mgnify:CR=1 FL=1
MTIYDIAKKAGVSASTVSRVINHKPGIKEETRLRVKETLEKYNYYPDETARGLVNQSSRFIGILVSDIRISHHAEGAYIIQRHLADMGYSCIIFNTGTEDESKEACIRQMIGRRVEAAVMIGSVFESERMTDLIKRYLKNLPIVISNGYLDLPNVYGVLADERGGMESCVKLLFDKGRRRLAFLNDSSTISNSRKQAGFEDGVAKFYPQGEPTVVKLSVEKNSLEFGYKATERLMKESPEVDGILYATDLCAAGGLHALFEMGISVPEQVSVIGVDNSIYAQLCRPKLTSLDNRLKDLSITCADILAKVVQRQEIAKKYMIFSEIVERQST